MLTLRRSPLLLALLTVITLGSLAHADPPPATPVAPVAPTAPTAPAAPAPAPASPTTAADVEVKSLLIQADALFRRQRHREAFVLYRKAHALAPSATTVYNLGRCYQQAGDDDEAIAFYGRFVALAPDAPNRAEVEDRIADLQERKAQRIARAKREAEEAAAERDRVRPIPSPPLEPETARRLKLAGWTLVATGAVSLGSSIAALVVAQGRFSDLKKLPPGTPFTSARADQIASAHAAANAGYALLGLGLAAATSGAVVLVYRSARLEPNPRGFSLSFAFP